MLGRAPMRKADKLLLVSIGYSACYWCHVMAHNPADGYIAKLMNEHFICVKVDARNTLMGSGHGRCK